MERYTKQTPGGGYTAEGLSTEELLAALGKYRSATYTMLTGSRFMLEEMQKRLNEPAEDIAGRLNALKRQLEPEDDGFRDVED